jgi:hypothetical protein
VPLDERTLSLLLVLLVGAVVALAAWVAWLQRSSFILRRRLRAVFSGAGEQGLDHVLDGILRRLDRADERFSALSALQEELEELLRRGTLRNVGVVRFNPFPDAGGDQSFAIALLDAEGTGIVLSSLHARTDTRVFAKPVQGGRSRYALSDEEQDAIRQALSPSGRGGG